MKMGMGEKGSRSSHGGSADEVGDGHWLRLLAAHDGDPLHVGGGGLGLGPGLLHRQLGRGDHGLELRVAEGDITAASSLLHCIIAID